MNRIGIAESDRLEVAEQQLGDATAGGALDANLTRSSSGRRIKPKPLCDRCLVSQDATTSRRFSRETNPQALQDEESCGRIETR